MGELSPLAALEVHTSENYLRCPNCRKPLTTNRGANWHRCEDDPPKQKPRLVN